MPTKADITSIEQGILDLIAKAIEREDIQNLEKLLYALSALKAC